MALWKRLWLLFSVIWVVVAALNAASILAFGEPEERARALTPLFFGLAVPALLYLAGWAWARWKSRK